MAPSLLSRMPYDTPTGGDFTRIELAFGPSKKAAERSRSQQYSEASCTSDACAALQQMRRVAAGKLVEYCKLAVTHWREWRGRRRMLESVDEVSSGGYCNVGRGSGWNGDLSWKRGVSAIRSRC
jgi:hypothetical protein